MNTVFKKYVLFFSILLLSGIANTFAINNDNTDVNSDYKVEKSDNALSLNQVKFHFFNSNNQKNNDRHYSDLVEVKNTEENEEEVSFSKKKNSELNYTFSLFHTAFLNVSLAQQTQEKETTLSFPFENTAVKLHVLYQVFII